ncbi:MAG: hypothetical protein EZS26_001720 [Candidatus Ordinivivax streblomastigis]|uniref:FrrB n=1 Tax=Candidatus Ordinivivax streblomastigis TaxID=2540710 RepID=A0A5M8P114_9BACT|nr:MAG: hypothetical protein EZS26_001720 [Candidatus Ordinivivax streblomastigis]
MKKIIAAIVVLVCATGMKAQEVTVGTDVVSSYVWRGGQLSGTSIQPSFDFSAGSFSVGAWGSVDLLGSVHKELDLTIGYEVQGVSLSITDYWIPVSSAGTTNPSYFVYDTDKNTGHTFEATIGYTLPIESCPLSLAWSTNFAGVDGVNADGKTAYSSYFEASYPFNVKDIAVEAAIGLVPWATNFYSTNGFNITNISLKAGKEIKIADFTIPVFGQFVVNPRTEDAFLVFGVSF